MESAKFDTLTRRLSGAGSSRRQTLRALGNILLGGALSGVAARLGRAEDAEAKAKQHKGKQHEAKPKPKRKPQVERQGHDQLQAEGKGKKKKHKKPKPLPPECQHCN